MPEDPKAGAPKTLDDSSRVEAVRGIAYPPTEIFHAVRGNVDDQESSSMDDDTGQFGQRGSEVGGVSEDQHGERAVDRLVVDGKILQATELEPNVSETLPFGSLACQLEHGGRRVRRDHFPELAREQRQQVTGPCAGIQNPPILGQEPGQRLEVKTRAEVLQSKLVPLVGQSLEGIGSGLSASHCLVQASLQGLRQGLAPEPDIQHLIQIASAIPAGFDQSDVNAVSLATLYEQAGRTKRLEVTTDCRLR